MSAVDLSFLNPTADAIILFTLARICPVLCLAKKVTRWGGEPVSDLLTKVKIIAHVFAKASGATVNDYGAIADVIGKSPNVVSRTYNNHREETLMGALACIEQIRSYAIITDDFALKTACSVQVVVPFGSRRKKVRTARPPTPSSSSEHTEVDEEDLYDENGELITRYM